MGWRRMLEQLNGRAASHSKHNAVAVPAAAAIVISCSPLNDVWQGQGRSKRERKREREGKRAVIMHCEMQCVALPRPPRMNRLHLEGATPHRVARFGLSLSAPSCYIWVQLLSDAGTLINITSVSLSFGLIGHRTLLGKCGPGDSPPPRLQPCAS